MRFRCGALSHGRIDGAWIWRLRPGTDMGLFEEVYARLLGNAVSLDAVGHYARPDLFSLQVNTSPLRPVEFRNDLDAED